MSEDELGTLLNGSGPPGVVHLPPQAGSPPVLDLAREAGWQTALLDLQGAEDKAEFLARCATALCLPEWFGRNWDALADCLSDLSWWPVEAPAKGRLLLVRGWEGFRDAAPGQWRTAEEVFASAALHWSTTGTPMAVLVEES